MSIVISWATPDLLGGFEIDVRKVRLEKKTPVDTFFVFLVEIDATNDGLPKSESNEWVNAYEDPAGTDQDLYRIQLVDAAGNRSAFSQEGLGGFLSRFHDIMDRSRKRLGDGNPFFYQLEKTTQVKWDATMLGTFVRDTLDEFNGWGPMVTRFSFENLPDDAVPVLIHGIMACATEERAIKEIANVLRYNDGVSFEITNRPADYRTASQNARQRFETAATKWKLSHRPRAMALGSQRLPFRVTRPLSLLPNMRNVFGF